MLADDWELAHNVPSVPRHILSWFKVGREVKHVRTKMIYTIVEIGHTTWKGYDGDQEWIFSLIGVEGFWSPVE